MPAALAMVLGWPDTELVGITTTADPEGLRAGYLAHFLGLAGRSGYPCCSRRCGLSDHRSDDGWSSRP